MEKGQKKMPLRFVWDEYKLIKLIQHGSFATIYKAVRRGEQPPQAVAIKIAAPAEGDNNSPEAEASFLRSLAHPHTIPILDTISGPHGLPALVLEYCPSDLFTVASRADGPLPARSYLKQILTAVAFFHAKNIVHCDLKPENILVNREGVLKICDFGFAETVSPSPTIWFKGSLEYLAPEYVWDEAVPHSPSTDMWSVGCIFYMILMQEALPFASLAQTSLVKSPSDKARYSLESILGFLDPLPGEPSETKPWPADLGSRPRRFKFFRGKISGRLWKESLAARGVSPAATHLLSRFWELCPLRRIDARTALTHPFFSP